MAIICTKAPLPLKRSIKLDARRPFQVVGDETEGEGTSSLRFIHSRQSHAPMNLKLTAVSYRESY